LNTLLNVFLTPSRVYYDLDFKNNELSRIDNSKAMGLWRIVEQWWFKGAQCGARCSIDKNMSRVK
jgi:hypothetical protein